MIAIRLLLVDDEEDFVTTMAERLEMRNMPAAVALSGTQALERIEADLPDVIVLDLRMPGMDGVEVLRRVKQAHPQVEVIIMTGHGSDRDEETARKLGAFDYLRKPVGIEGLIDAIGRAADHGAGRPDGNGDPGRPEGVADGGVAEP